MHRVSFLALSSIMVTQLACADDVCLGGDCPLGTTCNVDGTCVPLGFANGGGGGGRIRTGGFTSPLDSVSAGTVEGSIGGLSFDGVAEAYGEQRGEFTSLVLQTFDDSARTNGMVILAIDSTLDALPVSTEIQVTWPYVVSPQSGVAEVNVYVCSNAPNNYHYDEPVEGGSMIIEEQRDGSRVVVVSTQLGDERTTSQFTFIPGALSRE